MGPHGSAKSPADAAAHFRKLSGITMSRYAYAYSLVFLATQFDPALAQRV